MVRARRWEPRRVWVLPEWVIRELLISTKEVKLTDLSRESTLSLSMPRLKSMLLRLFCLQNLLKAKSKLSNLKLLNKARPNSLLKPSILTSQTTEEFYALSPARNGMRTSNVLSVITPESFGMILTLLMWSVFSRLIRSWLPKKVLKNWSKTSTKLHTSFIASPTCQKLNRRRRKQQKKKSSLTPLSPTNSSSKFWPNTWSCTKRSRQRSQNYLRWRRKRSVKLHCDLELMRCKVYTI